MKSIQFVASVFIFAQSVVAQNCNLQVPPNPLSATGLATPYIVSTTTANVGIAATSQAPCSQLLPNGNVFVEASILNPVTGAITVYYPLVVDTLNPKLPGGPAGVIATPVLPANAVVGIWFGGDNTYTTLTEAKAGTALIPGNCVNGLTIGNGANTGTDTGAALSQFGEFAYCNAVNFFAAANALIADGLLTVPPVGLTNRGVPCPTVRSFSVVDQDQSDNSASTYGVTDKGTVAQLSVTNIGNLNLVTSIVNPSDNKLLSGFIAPAVGCKTFTAPDAIDGAVDPNNPTLIPIVRNAIPLDELQAAASGNANPALVPSYHPMVLTSATPVVNPLFGPIGPGQNGNTPVGIVSLAKINSYRAGVNQPLLTAVDSPADVIAYCEGMLAETGPFLALHALDLSRAGSLIPKLASNLLALLVVRFGASYITLGCAGLTGTPNPLVAFDPLGNAFNGNIPAATTNIATLYPVEAALGGFVVPTTAATR